MTKLTPVFLVLLRLAIGWHIFFEGVEKVQNPSWSSAAYLREAAGPLAEQFQDLGGDPVLDRMTPLPVPANVDPTTINPRDRLPPALAREWESFYQQFISYYELDKEGKENARLEARNRFEQRQEQTANWLIQGKQSISSKPSQFGTVPLERTTPQRVEEYRKALEQYRRKKDEVARFGAGAAADLSAARNELNRQRNELLASLDAQTSEMKSLLLRLVHPSKDDKDDKKADWVVAATGKDPIVQVPLDRWETFTSLDWLNWSRLDWSDFVVRWGLPIVGGCLLLGLFTRTACIAGALFLVLFYIPMPPWPGLPDNPRAEGHYLFINKNVIEMLALLALATTRSGRWVGLDALIALCRGEPGVSATGETRTQKPAAIVPVETPPPAPAPEPAVPPRDPFRELTADDLGPTPPSTPANEIKTIIYSPKDEDHGH